jgi:hypothetical protein
MGRDTSSRSVDVETVTTSTSDNGTVVTETTDTGSAEENYNTSSIVGWRKFATAMGQSFLLVGAYLLGRWAKLVPESGWESVVDAVKILGVALIAGNTVKGFGELFKKG